MAKTYEERVGQELDGDGDLICGSRPTERYVIHELLNPVIEFSILSVEQLSSAVGHDRTRGNPVYENSVGRQFECHRLGQIRQACLGSNERALETHRN